MRLLAKSLTLLAAVIVVACLSAGCGSTVSSALGNLPSRTAADSAAPDTTPATPDATSAPPPTSAPPSTSAPPPTSVAPATTTVTVTASQPVTPSATSAPATSPTASETPGTSSGTHLLWLWILLAVAVLVGLIIWISHSAGRRSATAATWRSRLIDAYAKGSALHDAMSVAEASGLAARDAGARWADIQRRADDLTQTLYALREAVPDPDDQARIADVLASLQGVRSAMDAERVPGAVTPELAQVVRSRLYAFEQSLRALRDSDQGFS